MKRLLFYAAAAIAVFSCTYGTTESSSRVDTTNATMESTSGMATDTSTVVGESINGGINADSAGTNRSSSGVTGTTNNRERSGNTAGGDSIR